MAFKFSNFDAKTGIVTGPKQVVGYFEKSGKAPMTRGQALIVQLSKLINYYFDDLEPEWGGGTAPLSLARLQDIRANYESTVMRSVDDFWINKIDQGKPWGPNNTVLTPLPCPDLGLPYELYLGLRGHIVTMKEAVPILGVDMDVLVRLKLRHLLDELVVREALKGLLRPPPLWSK